MPLVNAGAEEPADDDPGRPAGVDTWHQDHLNVTFSRDTAVKRSGEASFYIHNKGSQPPGKDGTAVFMFTGPIDAGLDYTATGWLKTRDVSNASIRVRLRSAEGQWISCDPKFEPRVGTHDWTRVTCTWPGVAGAAEFVLFLRVRGPGEAWFDDIQVHDDFEAGLVGIALLFEQVSEAMRPIDQHLIRSRLIPWQTFKLNADGFLIWCLNRWKNNDTPIGKRILTDWNPLLDGVCPTSSAMYVYPGENGPISSLRLENFRDGIEDYELLVAARELLEKVNDGDTRGRLAEAITIGDELTSDLLQYTADTTLLFAHRQRLIEALVEAGRAR